MVDSMMQAWNGGLSLAGQALPSRYGESSAEPTEGAKGNGRIFFLPDKTVREPKARAKKEVRPLRPKSSLLSC